MKLIGKGTFSKVYQKSTKVVIIKSLDWAKEALSMGWHRNLSGCFPKCEQVDHNTYEMEFYPKEKNLKEALRSDQYDLYKALRSVFKALCNDSGYCRDSYSRYNKVYEAIEQAKINGKVKNDMLSFIESLANYGSDLSFEISPRNIAVKNGRLILLDCFFFGQQLENRNYHSCNV